jgi:rod shape determining protein RodA
MVIGFFPVVGIPLPFLSYGGSSILTAFVGLGLVISVRRGRYVN